MLRAPETRSIVNPLYPKPGLSALFPGLQWLICEQRVVRRFQRSVLCNLL